jgi:hypothetical protein
MSVFFSKTWGTMTWNCFLEDSVKKETQSRYFEIEVEV